MVASSLRMKNMMCLVLLLLPVIMQMLLRIMLGLRPTELAKSFVSQGEKSLNDLFRNKRSNNVKEDIGFASKTKKKNNDKKKAKPTQAKEKNMLTLWEFLIPFVGCDATRVKATHDDFAGFLIPVM
jgi:hypothetical protein